MSANHSVSDLVSRIKNGVLAKKTHISVPKSSLKENILKVLKDEGYIASYTVSSDEKKADMTVSLKYSNDVAAIKDIETISKPGRREYCGYQDIPVFYNGLGTVILSTPGGVVTDYYARENKLGGEILFKIF